MKEEKRFFSVRLFLILLLVLFFAVLLRALWVLASTGLISIPVFSSWAFEMPSPLREVSSNVNFQEYISQTLDNVITRRMQSKSGFLQNRSMQVVLPEDILSKGFRSFLQTQAQISFAEPQQSQLVIEQTGMVEVFLPVKYHKQKSAVKLWVYPSLQEGKISFDLTDMWIGSWHVPGWLRKNMAQEFLPVLEQRIQERIDPYVFLQEFIWSEKTLTVQANLTVQIRPFESFR